MRVRPEVALSLVALLGTASVPAAAVAQDRAQLPADTIGLELNKLEPVEGACRVYLVLRNGTPETIEALQLELVSFDGEGIISQRTAVSLNALPAGKTLVTLFDVPETPCDRVKRLLLNEVLECRNAQGPLERCLDLLQPSARGDVAFWK